MMGKVMLWHPLLFSILFVVMPFMPYAGLTPPAQMVVPFLVICTFALVLYFIINCIVKNKNLAIAILSPLLIFLFNYGILHQYISELTVESKLKGFALIITLIFMLSMLLVYIVKVSRVHEGTIININKILFVTAVALIIFNTLSITSRYIVTAETIESSRMAGISLQKPTFPLPDIYFVILDEYAAPSQMKSYFQYDMSPFVEYLRQKDFMVTEMTTEVPGTIPNMNARLNMETKKSQGDSHVPRSFLNSLFESMDRLDTSAKQIIYIKCSKVMGTIKNLGYQFIFLGNGCAWMRNNPLADQNITSDAILLNELSYSIIHSSVLRVLINRYTFSRNSTGKVVLDAFTTLEQMPLLAGKPKFVYAHILCPHPPYIFGANGEISGFHPGESKDDKRLYLDQHIFITKKVIELVDKKLSDSQPPPVIIIQADHGSRMDNAGAHQIFSAVYIPNYKGKPWQDKIPAINTFRLLFNELLGINLEIM